MSTTKLETSRRRVSLTLLLTTIVGLAIAGAFVAKSAHGSAPAAAGATTHTAAPAAGSMSTTVPPVTAPTTAPTAPTATSTPTTTAPSAPAAPVAPPAGPTTSSGVPIVAPAPSGTPAPGTTSTATTAPPRTETVPNFVGQSFDAVQASGGGAPLGTWTIKAGSCTTGGSGAQGVEVITSQNPAPGTVISASNIGWPLVNTIVVNYEVAVSPVSGPSC